MSNKTSDRGFTPLPEGSGARPGIKHIASVDTIHITLTGMHDHAWANQDGHMTVFMRLVFTGQANQGYLFGQMARVLHDLDGGGTSARVEQVPPEVLMQVVQVMDGVKDRQRPLGAIEAAVQAFRDGKKRADARGGARPPAEGTRASEARPRDASAIPIAERLADPALPRPGREPRGVEIAGATHHVSPFTPG